MHHTWLLAAESVSGGGIGGLFVALGLDWRSLLLNAVAFLLVVWILGKFVYPILVKALDAKREELQAASKSQEAAQAALTKAEESAAEIVKEARSSAREITTTAKQQATELMKSVEEKAATQADRITTEAREQLARDVEAARRDLKAETARLVVSATERVLEEKLDGNRDAALVEKKLGESR